jgi:hypothetical protein
VMLILRFRTTGQLAESIGRSTTGSSPGGKLSENN